jgi:hypothetical protein
MTHSTYYAHVLHSCSLTSAAASVAAVAGAAVAGAAVPPNILADIEPGQGMIADGRNAFVGRDCPKDTYGEHSR